MDTVHVAVAVIGDQQGRILLAKRAEDAHQGGLWEFPGGKLEPGESLSSALRRECREELGIQVSEHRPLIQIEHRYPDRRVLLDVHRVTAFGGDAQGLEGQPLAWVKLAELTDYPMPAADGPIVNAIRLPERYLITPALVADRFLFLDELQASLERGVKLVQFRVQSSADPRHRLAEEVQQLCRRHRVRLLINQDIALARNLGADGVHLKSTQLPQLTERPAGLDWVAASCHSAQDLDRVTALGVDFAVLSPVKPTQSHVGAPALGWDAFGELAKRASVPVFALGGVGPADLQDAWQSGAQGVAAISGLWGRGAT